MSDRPTREARDGDTCARCGDPVRLQRGPDASSLADKIDHRLPDYFTCGCFAGPLVYAE